MVGFEVEEPSVAVDTSTDADDLSIIEPSMDDTTFAVTETPLLWSGSAEFDEMSPLEEIPDDAVLDVKEE